MKNLFTHEKHYLTLNNYLRNRFGEKVFKISLNPGFTCPNRDGKIDSTGCLFCSEDRSGDFSGKINLNLNEQFLEIKQLMQNKWQTGSFIAYLQAGTNTYAPLDVLEQTYQSLLTIDDNVKIISIATRPDCINPEIIKLLTQLQAKKEVWIELGFQTMHKKTYDAFHRGYDNQVFENAIALLNEAKIPIIVHIINGLPNETKKQMIETVQYLSAFSISGIKIHMLHIMENTVYGTLYQANKLFNHSILSMEEYVDIVVEQLRYLPPHLVIHRLTGDAPSKKLIAPLWIKKKFVTLNEIDKLMRKNNIYQGDKFHG